MLIGVVIIFTMSKNTSSTKFRKIDVDQYSEDRYEDDTASDDGPQGPNEGEVSSLLSQYPFWSSQLLHLYVSYM